MTIQEGDNVMDALIKLFEESGDYFCLDVNSSTLFQVEKPIYEYLMMDDIDAITEIYGSATANYVISEIEKYKNSGFFQKGNKKEKIEEKYTFDKVDLLSLSLMVSSGCNMRCRYCFNDGGTAPCDSNEVMNLEVAKTAVDFLVLNSTQTTLGIDFFGGEPLFNITLIREIVAYCTEKYSNVKWLFSMITNGTLITDDIVEFFVKYHFHIVVSYDGLLQDYQRKSAVEGRKNRELVRESVRKLVAVLPKKDISIRCILTHTMVPYIKEIVAEAKELGVRVLFGPVTLQQGNPMNMTDDDYDIYLRDVEYLFAQYENWEDVVGITSVPFIVGTLIKGAQRYYSCGVGIDQVGVSSTGNIYPCHRFIGVDGMEMGNIYDGINHEIYSQYAHRYVDNMNGCDTCWAKYFCGGGCAHESMTYEDSPFVPAEERCKLTRHEIEMGVKLYIKAFKNNSLDRVVDYLEIPTIVDC